MIPKITEEMIRLIKLLKDNTLQDIEDVKKANHEKLLDRNDIKLQYMEQIASLKEQMNQELLTLMQDGVDVNIYRDDVDVLEQHLLELSKLNAKLAAIVLPIKEMYKEIIADISRDNGGILLEVRA